MIKKKRKKRLVTTTTKSREGGKENQRERTPRKSIKAAVRSLFDLSTSDAVCVCVCVPIPTEPNRKKRMMNKSRAKKNRKLNIDVELISGSNMTLNVNSMKNYSADFQWNSTVRPSFRRSTFGGRSQPERKKTLIISREGKHKKRRNVLSWW